MVGRLKKTKKNIIDRLLLYSLDNKDDDQSFSSNRKKTASKVSKRSSHLIGCLRAHRTYICMIGKDDASTFFFSDMAGVQHNKEIEMMG